MHVAAISESALSLFRLHIDRHGDVAVDDSTREAYRELASAGLVRAMSTYAGGPESAYRLTKEGFERKAELLACVKESG